MVLGAKDYRAQLIRMALGSNGALTLEYLESLGYEYVVEINKITTAMISEKSNG